MRKKAKKSYNFKDILDSDDELPTEYVEIPFVPAFQNDNRFEYIEECKKIKEELLHNEDIHLRPLQSKKNENIVLFGYLNKKDTFCFHCLVPTTSAKTLLWFLNFLMLKDLQSDYKYRKTCLVPNFNNDYSVTDSESLKDCKETSRHRFKVVVNDMKLSECIIH